MAYEAQVSRDNPTCMLFLIDQSGSMADTWGATQGQTKDKGVATAINRMLHNLGLKCAKDEGIRYYFDVGVIYYKEPRGMGAQVGPAFDGTLSGRDLVPIVEVAESPLRVEERVKEEVDDTGEIIKKKVKFPIWFEPMADGGTPMCAALRHAHEILENWLSNHQDSFPPIVINITDGEATDGNPLADGQRIMNLKTNDGNVLLYNIHISSRAGQVCFPAEESELPRDQYALMLFNMSSELPPKVLDQAKKDFSLRDGARGFVFNADMVDLIRFLDIGTRVDFR
ncbi:MAG: vWA domain-containing protein [Desulfobaccales bacterium]